MSAVARIVCWFSCGTASAVASALALHRYRTTHDIVIARIVLDTEHPDSERFTADCERWFDAPIVRLRSEEFTDTWSVWEKRKYIAGIAGAPCTNLLKKSVRLKWQRPDDLHIFGYTLEELNRAALFKRQNANDACEFPLIERALTKSDCHAMVQAAGIELPVMYRMGYENNNCIGCPKGGAGYWNMIRRDFPPVFDRMAALSRRLGARLVKQDGTRIYLDELRPTTGRQKDAPIIKPSAAFAPAAAALGLA